MTPKLHNIFPESCLLIVVGIVIGFLLILTSEEVNSIYHDVQYDRTRIIGKLVSIFRGSTVPLLQCNSVTLLVFFPHVPSGTDHHDPGHFLPVHVATYHLGRRLLYAKSVCATIVEYKQSELPGLRKLK